MYICDIIWNNVLVAGLIFLVIVLALTIILLVCKHWLVNSGEVAIDINDGSKLLHAQAGKSLLATLGENGVHLSSACGGKGSCGQCKVQVLSGGGDILPTEAVHFSRKEIKDHWRLGCQVKVKNDLAIKVSESALDVKEWECEVISNKNVATFIKEFIVKLPEGEHMNFIPGSYAQIRIPKYEMTYDGDIDKSLIGDEYLPAWQKFGLFGLKAKNDEETVRAYSMANYPEEGDRIMLTVRIATPPFKPKPQVGFQDVPCGIASSYIFSLKPGDKVMMSGPYGDFHPIVDSKAEMIWVGGGAGMAPLRAQIMWMTKTLHTTDRKMSYFYGARALNEVFYLQSRSGSRCSRRGLHSRLRARRDVQDIPQGSSRSRGYRVLYVRPRPDEQRREQYALQPRRRAVVHTLRQLRRLTYPAASYCGGTPRAPLPVLAAPAPGYRPYISINHIP